MHKVLVIDDDRSVRHLVQHGLSKVGYEVLAASTGEIGLQSVAEQPPDVVLLDILLPNANGLELFRKIRAIDRELPIIFITCDTSSNTAIEAMRLGAFDYLTKPINLGQIEKLVQSAIASRRSLDEPVAISIGESESTSERFIGSGPAMLEVFKSIGRVAAQNVTVLIQGESGSGKELVARALVEHSERAEKPYVAINCAALPDQLVESELFGHERGSFTGAERRREGKFQQCDGGTIFLDEVGDMSLTVQSKVLRLLQEQSFERVGGSQTITTDVRVIAATNRNLEQMVAAGTFREDLLYRLNGCTITLPPLREHIEDIVPLTEYFLRRARKDMNKEEWIGVSPETLRLLQNYDWPGNVRQLQSVVRQSLLNTPGTVLGPGTLPLYISNYLGPDKTAGSNSQLDEQLDLVGSIGLSNSSNEDTESNLSPIHPKSNSSENQCSIRDFIEDRLKAGSTNLYSETVREIERYLFSHVLAATGGNQSQAAILLGVTRDKVRDRIASFDIRLDRTVRVGK